MSNENNNVYIMNQQTSRKWILVLLVVILATIGSFTPPLLSAWVFGATKPLTLLSGTEWVSVITMITAAYIGGNVWQKHIQKNEIKSDGGISLNTSTEFKAGAAATVVNSDEKEA